MIRLAGLSLRCFVITVEKGGSMQEWRGWLIIEKHEATWQKDCGVHRNHPHRPQQDPHPRDYQHVVVFRGAVASHRQLLGKERVFFVLVVGEREAMPRFEDAGTDRRRETKCKNK
eukprot:4166029-Prymnesium_polylepis.1